MRLLLIGALLIVYAMFLTPAYFEPADLVISTTYIVAANEFGIPMWALMTWIISGYIALIIGLVFIGHLVIRIPHPVILLLVATFIGIVLCYYFFVVNSAVVI